MKHKAARKIQEELKNKSLEEKLEYWQKEYERQIAKSSLLVKEKPEEYVGKNSNAGE
jgi:hypothetical protein